MDAVDEFPRVLPPLVLADIDLRENFPRLTNAKETAHLDSAEIFGLNAPSSQDTVRIGREVDSRANLVCEAGLLVQLDDTVSSSMVEI
jgi:hypothetical protein